MTGTAPMATEGGDTKEFIILIAQTRRGGALCLSRKAFGFSFINSAPFR